MKTLPRPPPSLAALTCPPCSFDEVLHERQAETEAAVPAGRPRVRLNESLEDVRQQPGIDADAGVGNADHDAIAVTLTPRLGPLLRPACT